MSAFITITCNGEYLEGLCPRQIMLNTTDLTAATDLVTNLGWTTSNTNTTATATPTPTHRCPACSHAGRTITRG